MLCREKTASSYVLYFCRYRGTIGISFSAVAATPCLAGTANFSLVI